MSGLLGSQAIHQLRAQAVHQWMKVVEEAITNHAEFLDTQRMAGKTLKLDASASRMQCKTTTNNWCM